MSDNMSIDKKEPSQEHSEESQASSPVEGQEPPAQQLGTQEAQPVKRKGGRKPIYATSEERKQRNRQAQAAFRERRTEYIKHLEDAIKVHETNLTSLQAAHRSAADECLMLRYKNSLLERILLEKGAHLCPRRRAVTDFPLPGIDVQAELRAKTGSPNLGPTHMPQNMVQPPPIQRAMLNRHHHSRRSASSVAPKLEPGITSLPPPTGLQQSVASPKTRPTPPSHAASPTNPAPPYGGHMGPSSPTSSEHAGMRPMPPPRKQQMAPMAGIGPGARQPMMQQQQHQQHQQHQHQHPSAEAQPASFYPTPTPSFQNHFQQLEQEYAAPTDMMDDPEPDTPGPGPYPSAYPVPPNLQAGVHMQPATSGPPGQGQQPMASADQDGHSQGQGYPSMSQLLDPALDWDPFGLSASMAFPAQFSFDTSNMR
ncbi:hypothetical protein GGR56DRAFT_625119 [Xylariaceae sp. FL0804]|nr:hypothetical protein GGR56DRAFT_625119 [Xylariaceae sp. FL0804]